jgi:hypothetical protein
MEVHAYDSSYLGGGDWEDHGQGQPMQKVRETPSQPISWVYWHTPLIPATQEAITRRIVI